MPKLIAVVQDERADITKRVHAMWAIQKKSEDMAAARQTFEDLRKAFVIVTPVWERVLAPEATIKIQAARIYGIGSYPYGGPVASSKGSDLVEKLLRDQDAAVRCAAARAFARSTGAHEESLLALLSDSGPWVRFAVRSAIPIQGEWVSFQELEPLLEDDTKLCFDGAWRTITGFEDGLPENIDPEFSALDVLRRLARSQKPIVRTRTASALGTIAYRVKPWDGHWWGTQPVKNPPPLPSVAWEGTAKAIETLTVALADADSGVRLAAAQAFANFLLDDSGKHAAAALRARLTAETDPASRRQLIESLGVQKDPQAMEVFRQIAR